MPDVPAGVEKFPDVMDPSVASHVALNPPSGVTKPALTCPRVPTRGCTSHVWPARPMTWRPELKNVKAEVGPVAQPWA